VVITLNSTQFRTMYNRLTVLMATALHTCLVAVKLPVSLTTSGERHVQNLTGEEIFKNVAFYSQVCFLCSLLWLCKYKWNWIKLFCVQGVYITYSLTSVCGYK
jgi:hypothetical protein